MPFNLRERVLWTACETSFLESLRPSSCSSLATIASRSWARLEKRVMILGATPSISKPLAVLRAEQTGRIHRVQRERRTLAGLMAKEERKAVLKTLRNAQRLLQTVEVL